MKTKDLLVKGMKSPQKVPRYLWLRYVKKTVPFSHETVAGAELPQFSARLYKEVKLLSEAIGDFHTERSLEIGSGYGRLTPWIAEYSDQHYAVDPSPILLNDARKLFPNFHFFQTKGQKLPFPDHYFGLCITWTVLIHIPPSELSKIAAEMKRVCSPEATIILCESVGKCKAPADAYGYWVHPIEEWANLFLPWKMTWHVTGFGSDLEVMRFERDSCIGSSFPQKT